MALAGSKAALGKTVWGRSSLTRQIKNICMSLLLLCLLLVPSIGMAAEITDQELTRLEQIFQQLEINNNRLLADLTQSKTDLTQARLNLAEYQKDLATLQAQLLTLKRESQEAKSNLLTAQSYLENANQSLKQYEREMKAERNRLKFERNLLLLAVGYLALK
jgi:septal ring factor EnvC (AmiA/AmiB activator)